jgi:hypothetical protein
MSDVNGSTKLSMHQMEVFEDKRLSWFPKDFLKLKELTIMKPFPL